MDSTVIDNNTLLTVNLNDDPDLHKFKGPCSYGYSCHSQYAATYSDIVFTDPSNIIFDMANDDAYIRSNNNWVKDPSVKFENFIGYGKLLFRGFYPVII